MRLQFSEKLMEDFIKRYPVEFLGEELTFVSRQRKLSGFRTDLVFEDKDGAFLIVELQIEALDRSHFYRTLEYRDFLLEENENRRVRVMLVCNSVPEKFLKLLKIHNVECRVIEKREFSKKVRGIEPKAVIRNKSKPRMPVTAISLLADLERKPKAQRGRSDILGFWLRTKEDSESESMAFRWPISPRKVFFKSFDGRTSLAAETDGRGEGVFVPKQLLIAAEPFQGRTATQQLSRISDWLKILEMNCHHGYDEIIFGWNSSNDYLEYEKNKNRRAWELSALSDHYRRKTSYDEVQIRSDLNFLASLKLFVGIYPNVTALPPFPEYSIEKGAGSLYDRYLKWIKSYQARVDPEILGPCEWLTVRFPKIDRTYFRIVKKLIDHVLFYHCNKSLNLATPCPLCLISPRTLDQADEKLILKVSRYFAYVPLE